MSDLTALLDYPWPGVGDNESLAREINATMIRFASSFGFTAILAWDRLSQDQKDFWITVASDLRSREVLSITPVEHETFAQAPVITSHPTPDNMTRVLMEVVWAKGCSYDQPQRAQILENLVIAALDEWTNSLSLQNFQDIGTRDVVRLVGGPDRVYEGEPRPFTDLGDGAK